MGGSNGEGRIAICCPSKGRADFVKTTALIPSIKLIVPGSEEEDYKRENPNTEVIGTPPEVRGITKTRQWILDNFEEVFMIDDDVTKVQKNFENDSSQAFVTEVDKIVEIINETVYITREIGAYVFSFSKTTNPLTYTGHEPFCHTGYMNASYCGFLKGHGLSYDLSMNEGEDHYISCLNMYKHRYCLIDERYSFITDGNFKAKGGCNGQRTRESMIQNTMHLREIFGEAIICKEPTAVKKNVNIGERSLRFPY